MLEKIDAVFIFTPMQQQCSEGGILLFVVSGCVCVSLSTWQLLNHLRYHHEFFTGARYGQKLM